MNTRRIWLAAALAATSIASFAARAGEITLYQHEGFQGPRATFSGTAPNIRHDGFNDRTSSIVVHSGRWQACMDANFQGECIELVPGQYASIDHRFNDRISSLREIEAHWDGRDDDRWDHDRWDRDRWDHDRGGRRGRGSVTFYDAPGFRGDALSLRRDEDNFVERGYNDRAGSMVIERGNWQICEHIQYGGRCRTFAPGRYAYLGREFVDRISSARLVGHQGGDRDDGWRRRHDGVQLFSGTHFGGEQMTVRGDESNLFENGFNDRAQSAVIHEGQWQLCQHAGYAGQCMTLNPGSYANLGSLTSQLSSLRRVQ